MLDRYNHIASNSQRHDRGSRGNGKKSRLKLYRYTVVLMFWTQMVKTVAFSSIHLKSYIDSALILMKETAI